MSLKQADQWLQKHTPIIPTLDFNLDAIQQKLEQDPDANLSDDLSRDPGLILHLLSKVNVKRGGSSGRDLVESPEAAAALLGASNLHALITERPACRNILKKREQVFLFQQIINRGFHNQEQATQWARLAGYKQVDSLRNMALMSYLGELLCCLYDFTVYFEYIQAGATESACQQLFGFRFSHLTEAVANNLHLPELLALSITGSTIKEPKAQLLGLTATICHQCEYGWSDQSLTHAYQQIADLLKIPLDKVIKETHRFAIIAARQSWVEEAWHPASRLILIKDQHYVFPKQESSSAPKAAQAPVSSNQTKKLTIEARIKHLVRQTHCKQTDILNTCVKGLFEEKGFSRVCVFLLSQDKQMIQNRINIGLDAQSPFRNYKIELTKSGLLKMLLSKPQAIWINNDSFKKYHKLLPPSLMASIMTNQFIAMSLFIGNQPLGIVYADRTGTAQTLDPSSFSQFKQLISLTSKALTLLAKR